MSVIASFTPERLTVAPGETAALLLELHNLADEECTVKLRPSGGLATQTVLQSDTLFLDPNERFSVPVTIDASASLPAGIHTCVVELDEAGDHMTATATVEISESSRFAARLEPTTSRAASAGRHKVEIENSGNVALMVELDVTTSDDVAADLAAPAINIDPGKTAKIELRIAPRTRYWSGAVQTHPFSVGIHGSNGEVVTLDGEFQQGPRVRPWLLPAFIGMTAALLVGTLAWFLLLRPAVEDIATDEAAALDAVQNDELAATLVEIEAAAAEASELPLGEPVDLRLEVSAGGASSQTTAFIFDEDGNGRVLSISDVIFQNPTGAVGTVELLRDDKVLLKSNTANFRDLDFHLVAPFRVTSRTEIALRVACDTPGPGTDACDVAATIIGFVDNT